MLLRTSGPFLRHPVFTRALQLKELYDIWYDFFHFNVIEFFWGGCTNDTPVVHMYVKDQLVHMYAEDQLVQMDLGDYGSMAMLSMSVIASLLVTVPPVRLPSNQL